MKYLLEAISKIENNIDFIAHSFVRNKQDILDIQKILDDHKSPIKIISKIENQSYNATMYANAIYFFRYFDTSIIKYLKLPLFNNIKNYIYRITS